MSNLKSEIVDKIVRTCLSLYDKLPKTGKPVKNEWTVLSCVVKYEITSDVIEVVSLGTGSKCIGATKMSPLGDILNDSHAEVIARRAFLLYLYDNIEKALNNQPSIFNYEASLFKLKEQVEFIFYSSQLPCGDASIIAKSGDEEHFGNILQSNKRKFEKVDKNESKRPKIESDIHRTGAKCLPGSEQDPKAPGSNYHTLGQVRTKPGRGDRTMSVSCSDKMAKWTHMGIQGRLLHMLCGKIHIKYFIFGAGTPFSEEALNRALLNRHVSCPKPNFVPEFHQTSLPFSNIRTDDNIRPSAGSIVWIKLWNPISEVAIQGKKLGVTKKKANLPSSSLSISKYNIYKRFLSILYKNKELNKIILGDERDPVPYNKMKGKAVTYSEEWVKLKDNFFKTWTVKPDIWDFCIK